jgi:hypothetical protein
MHGNFEDKQALSADGRTVTVTGWICWAGVPGEPYPCEVTVEIKQSGSGSRKATGASASCSRPAVVGEHLAWTVTATSKDPLEEGSAEANGWIKDTQGHTVFSWPASPPVTLQKS